MVKTLPEAESNELMEVLEKRFKENMHRHQSLEWEKIKKRLEVDSEKLWSLNGMEKTEGEPDVVAYDEAEDMYLFMDCVKETPKGRRSVCYDREGWESRKKYKPENNAMDMAEEMGIELLSEEQYRALQEVETVDQKTSSWVLTPPEIRERGGALFCDFRYGQVFVYHNGADAYFGARGFRGVLHV
jgi:hypothetical protein